MDEITLIVSAFAAVSNGKLRPTLGTLFGMNRRLKNAWSRIDNDINIVYLRYSWPVIQPYVLDRLSPEFINSTVQRVRARLLSATVLLLKSNSIRIFRMWALDSVSSILLLVCINIEFWKYTNPQKNPHNIHEVLWDSWDISSMVCGLSYK